VTIFSEVKRPEREAGNCHTLPRFSDTCKYTTILHKPNGVVHNGTTNSCSKWLTSQWQITRNKTSAICQVHNSRHSRILSWSGKRGHTISCARVQFGLRTRDLINERTYCAPSDLTVHAFNLRTQCRSKKFTWQTQRHYCVIWRLSYPIKCITFMKCVGRTWIQIYWYICHAPLPFPLGNVSSNGHTLTHQFSEDSFLAWSWRFMGVDKNIYTVKYAARSLFPFPASPSWNRLVKNLYKRW
jgi:hypothetical protein